ncbi:MAG TPA: hypothetical protein VK348_12090 [Planctomycetota bacterium]|nr:hypothetical protein [Planctomycetota bacterium]
MPVSNTPTGSPAANFAATSLRKDWFEAGCGVALGAGAGAVTVDVVELAGAVSRSGACSFCPDGVADDAPNTWTAKATTIAASIAHTTASLLTTEPPSRDASVARAWIHRRIAMLTRAVKARTAGPSKL